MSAWADFRHNLEAIRDHEPC